MSIGQGKLLSKHNTRYTRVLRAYLGWSIKLSNVKISFLSFYRNIVCKNVSCDVGLTHDFRAIFGTSVL